MKLRFASLVLALAGSLFGIAAQAQTAAPAPKPTLYVFTVVGDNDSVGQKIVDGISAKLSAVSDQIDVKTGTPAVSDPDATAIRLLTTKTTDTTSAVAIVIVRHVKGVALPLYVGAGVLPVSAGSVDEEVTDFVQLIGQVFDSVESNPPTVSPSKTSNSIKHDSSSKS